MPQFVFTGPDGRTHEVTGPEGSTEAQAFAVLQERLQSQPAPTPSAPARTPTSAFDRAVTGLVDPVVGAAQIMEKTGAPRLLRKALGIQSDMDSVVREREREYVAPEGVDWARMGGNIANPISWAGGGTGVARAAAQGAFQSALAPVNPDDDFATAKAKQAALGATLGGAVGLATKGVVRATPEARALAERGVALTPGQAAGANSIVGNLEQSATSLPIAGPLVRAARNRGLEESNVAAAQSVADVVGKGPRLTKPPREAIEAARDRVSQAYGDALQGVAVPITDLAGGLPGLIEKITTAHPMVPTREARRMAQYITGRLKGAQKNGLTQLDGGMLKQLDSEIGQQVRNLRSSTVAADKTAAPAWADLQQHIRDAITDDLILIQGEPQRAALLDSANAAYRQLLAVEKAMLPGAESFTPRRLQRTLDKMGIRGTDLNKVADAMTASVGNTVPDSGTAGRLMANALPVALMGGGAGANSLGWDTVGGTMLAAGALGSRTGAKLMTGGTKPQRLADPHAARLAALAAAALRQPPEETER